MQIYHIVNLRKIGFGSFLEDDEGIIRIFRRPFVFAFNHIMLRALIWGGITVGLWFFLSEKLFFVWIFAGVFAFYKTFSAFSYWYANAVLMTTESLVFVEWKKFFERKSTRLDFWDIDEIQVERVGITAYIYNYGTLRFQKYGGELHAVHKISRPNRTAKLIEEYREQFLDAKNFTEESALKELISSMVQGHVREHGQPERMKNEEEKTKNQKNDSEPKKKSFVKNIFKADEMPIEVEKEMDDEGGIEIDLEDESR